MGQLVDRVREERAVYVIERSGTAVAQIGPVDRATFTIGDFKALVRSAPAPGEEYLAAVERAAGARNKPRRRTNPWER